MVKEEEYTENFFIWHISLRDFYSDIAKWLWSEFKPQRVIDFGCGNGFIISELKNSMLKYWVSMVRKFNLVISTKDAEHLPENSAQVFIANSTNHASDIIYFTAAKPGQRGVGHINEKPHGYRIEKFNSRDLFFKKKEL